MRKLLNSRRLSIIKSIIDQQVLTSRIPLISIGFFMIVWGYFAHIFSNLIWQDQTGNIFLQQNNAWADWALHFTQVSAMTHRSLFLSSSPILLDAPFTYSYFVNLITAVLIEFGLPFFTAFTLLSWILVSTGISLLFIFYNLLLKSNKKAIFSTLLFLFNGGTGIFWLLKSPEKWSESTHISELGIEWISVINSTFIPQRAFGLGFFVGILSLIILFHSWHKSGRLSKRAVIICGILLGSLPLLHMHTFVSLAIYFFSLVLSIYLINQPKKFKKIFQKELISWIGLGLSTALIAVLIFIFVFPDLASGQHLWFLPGWMSAENNLNPVIFWWRNWGVVPYLSALGMILVWKNQPKLAVWFIGFFVIFLFGNLFTLQPYHWDNTKLFAWTSVGFSALSVLALEKIWDKNNLSKILAIIIFCFSIASGAHDSIYTLKFQQHSFLMYTAEEMQLANWVESNSPANSIWLTSDKHNHWLYNLTGRQTVMGYQGWLWSHGYNFAKTSEDVKQMLKNPGTNLELYKKYRINYVVIGPSEKEIYKADISVFRNLFQTVRASEKFEIFAVTNDVLPS